MDNLLFFNFGEKCYLVLKSSGVCQKLKAEKLIPNTSLKTDSEQNITTGLKWIISF
jgi:hypothetical protein